MKRDLFVKLTAMAMTALMAFSMAGCGKTEEDS